MSPTGRNSLSSPLRSAITTRGVALRETPNGHPASFGSCVCRSAPAYGHDDGDCEQQQPRYPRRRPVGERDDERYGNEHRDHAHETDREFLPEGKGPVYEEDGKGYEARYVANEHEKDIAQLLPARSRGCGLEGGEAAGGKDGGAAHHDAARPSFRFMIR
jgi:hypothetical protein